MSDVVDQLVDATLEYATAQADAWLLGGDWNHVFTAADRVHAALIGFAHKNLACRSGAAHELELYTRPALAAIEGGGQ